MQGDAQPQPDNAQPPQNGDVSKLTTTTDWVRNETFTDLVSIIGLTSDTEAARNVQITKQECQSVGKDAGMEKYGKRMISMSIMSGLMSFFTMTLAYKRMPALVKVPVVIFMLLGPALPAIAATKAEQKKGLIRCFCCCTGLASTVNILFALINGLILVAVFQIQFFYPECGPELCNLSEQATRGPSDLIKVDCFATGIWEGYEQASESQWKAKLDGMKDFEGIGNDQIASTIVSNQKKYSDHECSDLANVFVDCPDELDGNSPPNGEAINFCQLDHDGIERFQKLAHGWAAPVFLLFGLFLHSSMALMLFCGCWAGRKMGQRDDAEI